MIRLIKLVCCALSVCATSSQAAVTSAQLQEMIFEEDVVGVETAVRDAHRESLSGEITFDELRTLTIVLFRTHPDTVDFLENWRAEMPESPYAMTAQAWALYNNASMTIANTNRAAVSDMAWAARRDMLEEGMNLALAAYDIAPDYVPTSDAVLRLNWSTDRLWGWAADRVLSDTMERTPNFGTLTRVAYSGRYRFDDLCVDHAYKIKEDGAVSVDVCIVGLLAENNLFRGNWPYIADVLDESDHPVLEYARIRRALDRRTPADEDVVMAYLANLDLSYPWLTNELWVAGEFRRLSFTEKTVNFMSEFSKKLEIATREQLVLDPYNYTVLRTATEPKYRYGTTNMRYDSQEYKTYVNRIALAQTYRVNSWMDAASYSDQIPPMLNTNDAAHINGIVYSDHDIYMITNFMQPKLNSYHSFHSRGASVSINGLPWPDEDVFNSEVGCRIVRLIRLFEDAAERRPEARNHVDGFRIQRDLAGVSENLRAIPACDAIWDASIETLYFTPIDIDRRSLLEIPEERLPF